MRIFGTAVLTVAGGVLFVVAAYMLTPYPFMTHGGPNTVTTQPGHIDYWTGEIAPLVRTTYDSAGTGQVMYVRVLPEDYQTRRVIPFPVAFVGGSLLTLTAITLASRRRIAPDSAVPAA